jgi:xylose dehydrogenase (NAD/NADP)
VADGTIGRLAHIRAALRITAPPGDVRRSPALGGGALADAGCYCTSAMRLFGGEPERVFAEAVFDGVDMRFAALFRLPEGVLGTFDAALDARRRPAHRSPADRLHPGSEVPAAAAKAARIISQPRTYAPPA